jgi:hypothetical protein
MLQRIKNDLQYPLGASHGRENGTPSVQEEFDKDKEAGDDVGKTDNPDDEDKEGALDSGTSLTLLMLLE